MDCGGKNSSCLSLGLKSAHMGKDPGLQGEGGIKCAYVHRCIDGKVVTGEGLLLQKE